MKTIGSKIAIGLALVSTAEIVANTYLRLENEIGQRIFCDEYRLLKGEERSTLESKATEYFGDKVHPSNQKIYFNAFVNWVEQCK